MSKTTTPAAEITKPARARKTRQPVKPLNKSTETVAANAKAEAERKKASKKALREALKAEGVKNPDALIEAAQVLTAEKDHGADNLNAARIEAEATGMSFEEACASMGIDATTGQPVAESRAKYFGPMLALRTAAKHYVKAANGQPCNGDELATLCGEYSRETVVHALIAAMNLPHNPYSHLNAGQQSMNLRNKARAQIKGGMLQIAEVDACLRMESAKTLIVK